jgi:glycosyltransferase involved in cell wall biosynthesis
LEEPLISIIVPIYKVEKYLRFCVDSLLSQSYKSLEIILVDDGSPDNCPAICDEYSRKDKRIKVIHEENGGLSFARNAGLDICTR